MRKSSLSRNSQKEGIFSRLGIADALVKLMILAVPAGGTATLVYMEVKEQEKTTRIDVGEVLDWEKSDDSVTNSTPLKSSQRPLIKKTKRVILTPTDAKRDDKETTPDNGQEEYFHQEIQQSLNSDLKEITSLLDLIRSGKPWKYIYREMTQLWPKISFLSFTDDNYELTNQEKGLMQELMSKIESLVRQSSPNIPAFLSARMRIVINRYTDIFITNHFIDAQSAEFRFLEPFNHQDKDIKADFIRLKNEIENATSAKNRQSSIEEMNWLLGQLRSFQNEKRYPLGSQWRNSLRELLQNDSISRLQRADLLTELDKTLKDLYPEKRLKKIREGKRKETMEGVPNLEPYQLMNKLKFKVDYFEEVGAGPSEVKDLKTSLASLKTDLTPVEYHDFLNYLYRDISKILNYVKEEADEPGNKKITSIEFLLYRILPDLFAEIGVSPPAK